MNKELSDRAWACLPREFRKEVKKEWRCIDNADRLPHDAFLRGKYQQMRDLFGHHNLTSDAEGEDDEMLTVSKKDMQFYYQYYKAKAKAELSAEQKAYYKGRTKVLLDLFGSKCLPDGNEDNFASKEPKFKVGDIVRIINDISHDDKYHGDITEIVYVDANDPDATYKVDIYDEDFGGGLWYSESELELLTKEAAADYFQREGAVEHDGTQTSATTFTDNRQSPCEHICPRAEDSSSDFRNHTRLQIAAMAMQGTLSNAERMKQYGEIALREPASLTELVAANALRYADALLSECEKGGNQ